MADDGFLLGWLQAKAICTAATDEQVYNQIMNYWDWISYQPNARRHLHHYRYGNGSVYPEDVRSLLNANPKIRSRVFTLIGAQLRQNPRADSGRIVGKGVDDGGEPPIRQQDYDSDDWLNANGNIDEVTWSLAGDYNPYDNRETDERLYFLRSLKRGSVFMINVQVGIRDPYTWHPLESRPTKCIHEAMERLKSSGAAEYITRGETTVAMPSVYLPDWVRN